MMKLALILALFAAASIDAHDRVACANNDYECQCESLLGGHHGLVGRGGRGGSWGGGGRGGRGRGRRSRSEDEAEDEEEEGIEEEQGQGREKRHSRGGRGRKWQALEACSTKTGITIPTPSSSDWGKGTKPQLPDEIRNCLIESQLTDQSILKDTGLDQTAVVTALTERLSNSWSNSWRVTLTADQASAIVGQVPQCDTDTASLTLRFLELQKCLVNKCTTTLTP